FVIVLGRLHRPVPSSGNPSSGQIHSAANIGLATPCSLSRDQSSSAFLAQSKKAGVRVASLREWHCNPSACSSAKYWKSGWPPLQVPDDHVRWSTATIRNSCQAANFDRNPFSVSRALITSTPLWASRLEAHANKRC